MRSIGSEGILAMTSRVSRRRKWKFVLRKAWEWQNKRCFYCDINTWIYEGRNVGELDPGLLKTVATREHLTRKADGGGDSLDNLVMACWDCNTNRGETHWEDYLVEKEELSRRNCEDPEDGYGLTYRPDGPTYDFVPSPPEIGRPRKTKKKPKSRDARIIEAIREAVVILEARARVTAKGKK